MNYTMKIIEKMELLPDPLRQYVEIFRNWFELGMPHWKTFFSRGEGYSASDAIKILEKNISLPPMPIVGGVPNLHAKLELIMRKVFEEVLGVHFDEEQTS